MNRPPVRFFPRAINLTSLRRWGWGLFAAFFVLVCAVAARMVQNEIETSQRQARYLSELGRDIAFTLGDGPSNSIRFPANGPYDLRLGYA